MKTSALEHCLGKLAPVRHEGTLYHYLYIPTHTHTHTPLKHTYMQKGGRKSSILIKHVFRKFFVSWERV